MQPRQPREEFILILEAFFSAGNPQEISLGMSQWRLEIEQGFAGIGIKLDFLKASLYSVMMFKLQGC